MKTNKEYYGYKKNDDEGYPLAAWIWGHRLRIGQHWMEYMLEFLNVLAGYEYELGRGINMGENNDEVDGYKCFTKLGLRRFVFYDDKEKTRHPDDDQARDLLEERLIQEDIIKVADTGTNPLELSKTLLRSLSAVEEQRSWYAKFLLPVHHNLLFWEGLRKGATKYRASQIQDDKKPHELDENIVFDPRNFFARGGEIYYLILSAGTHNNPQLRNSIANNLRSLLHEHNTMIGELALIVDDIWKLLSDNKENEKEFYLGWIPNSAMSFYEMVAEDLDIFLQSKLDPLETLDLFAHLINFHLTLYIYFRANTDVSSLSGTSSIPVTLLIDMLGGREGSVIRRISSLLYQEQEARILKRGEDYVSEKVKLTTHSTPEEIDQEIRRRFNINRLRKKTREDLNNRFDELLIQYRDSTITWEDFLDAYSKEITSLLMKDFRKNFLGVHRKLAKSIGFVAPKKGTNARYVLGDNILKALVLANVRPNEEIIFDQFLRRIFDRYGLIIGPEEARISGLYDRQHINSEYYALNRRALLEKMRNGGLAREYSDATAMVTG